MGENEWEILANKDPLWAACTSGKRRVNWRIDDFLATGEREVAWASSVAQEARIYPTRRSLAVDFGCGPGRLTGALMKRFQRVVGIDTSETMLTKAREMHPEESVDFKESVKTLENCGVDLVYSTFVLQHLTQREVDDCFREFARILHPEGLLIFQYPARPRCTFPGIAFLVLPTPVLTAIQRSIVRYPGIMSMSWMSPKKMVRQAAECGLTVLQYQVGPKYSPNWKDIWYFVEVGRHQ